MVLVGVLSCKLLILFKLALRRLTLLSSLQALVSRTPGRYYPPGDIGRGPPRLVGDCRDLTVVVAVAALSHGVNVAHAASACVVVAFFIIVQAGFLVVLMLLSSLQALV